MPFSCAPARPIATPMVSNVSASWVQCQRALRRIERFSIPLQKRKALCASGQVLSVVGNPRHRPVDERQRLANLHLAEGNHAHEEMRVGVPRLEGQYSGAELVGLLVGPALQCLLCVTVQGSDLPLECGFHGHNRRAPLYGALLRG